VLRHAQQPRGDRLHRVERVAVGGPATREDGQPRLSDNLVPWFILQTLSSLLGTKNFQFYWGHHEGRGKSFVVFNLLVGPYC